MVSNCCVCGVEKGSSRDFNFTFHRFPKNEDFTLKWWAAIGKKVYRNAQICSKHFKAEDYKNYEDLNLTRKILKPSAVPSRHIKSRVKLEPIENFSFDTEDILTDSVDIKDEKLQVDGSSTSTSIDNLASEITFDNEATLSSTASQTSSISTSIDNLLASEITFDNEATLSSTVSQTSSISTSIDNLASETTFDNEATLSSTVSKAKKRRSNKDNTSKALKKHRVQNGILGIMRREDFVDENAWLRFQKYINKVKMQYRQLSRKNLKIQNEISNCKELLKKQLSDDDLEI